MRLILATGSYIGDGFDDAQLDTLFLAMPISWKGTFKQYAGHLHDGKKVVEVYDYADAEVLKLACMYWPEAERLRGHGGGYNVRIRRGGSEHHSWEVGNYRPQRITPCDNCHVAK